MTQGSRRSRWKWIAGSLLGIVVLVGVGAFTQRERISRYLTIGQFEKATDRAALIETLVQMGEPVVADLLPMLKRDDAELCTATGQVFAKLFDTWTPKDPRSVQLATELLNGFPTDSVAGQKIVAVLMLNMRGCTESQIVDGCRSLAEISLKSGEVEMRLAGVQLAMWHELKLSSQVVPLMRDTSPEVRRSAMLFVGPRSEGDGDLISTEDLLAWLHDADAEVRRLCEMSLRSRGLREDDIRFGRRLTNPNPQERLALLLDLGQADAIDPTAWLERLSHDPVSAVRASAARVASERRIEFDGRLDEMSASDPDATVRAIAKYYRGLQK